MREYLTCKACGKILPIGAGIPIILDGKEQRVCLRCSEKLEHRDTREKLEEILPVVNLAADDHCPAGLERKLKRARDMLV